MPTNPYDPNHQSGKPPEYDAEAPGYETTDVNVNGVVVFLAGLFGFVLIFFVFCFVMGKVINSALEKRMDRRTSGTRRTHRSSMV